MSDFEAFSFAEGGESYDPAAFERFKEKIKKNAQFVAALKKQEQRQKKKEDELLKILMKFFKSRQRKGILLLASRVLEQNVPPGFVLAVLLLGNEELKQEIEKLLTSPHNDAVNDAAQGAAAITRLFKDASIPLRVKAEIDAWGKGLYEGAVFQPFRLLETALQKGGKVKGIVIDFMANVLQEFLEKSDFSDVSYETSYSFCEFLAQGIFQKVKSDLENQKLIDAL